MTPERSKPRVDPRISRRRRAVERNRRRRLAVRAAILAALLLVVWIALWSPLLKVRTVKVVGGNHTTSDLVAEAAGLDGDENILFVSTDEIAVAARDLPWVKSAEVERKLPSTVRVKIVERTPAMLVSTRAADWTVDAHGRVLQEGSVGPALPIVDDPLAEKLEPGDRISSRAVRAALRAFGRMPAEIRKMVRGVRAPDTDEISYRLAGDVLVRYGSASRVGDKNEVLAALLERVAKRDDPIAYIDVRVPSSPAIAPEAPAGTDEETDEQPVDDEL